MQPDFDSMNETDVREIIVRPLLERLGYAHGTAANIRTEVPLRYERAFLGRKKPTKDPALAGRADYICEVVSFGRWCVEVKAPGESLTQDDVEQAHTYSAHPEISASYFLLTNGREFKLFATGSLGVPVLRWEYEQTDRVFMNLINIVGPEAIKKLRKLLTPDVGKPLGLGLPPQLELIGGEVHYGEHQSNHPLINGQAMKGAIAPVTGKYVERRLDGLLHAVVSVRSPLQGLSELNRLVGLNDFEFYSIDEYVSTDINWPTVFQNFIKGRLEPGTQAQLLPGLAPIVIPFGFDFTVFTEAIGFAKDDLFQGVFHLEYNYSFIEGGRPNAFDPLQAQIAAAIALSPTAQVKGEGTYSIRTKPLISPG